MAVRPHKVPPGLGEAGRELWRAIAKQVAADGLTLDAREQHILKMAAQEADVAANLDAAFVGEPPTVRGAQGQTVAHPLIGEARRSRAAMQSLLKAIDLVDPTTSKPGSGSRTTSTQARAAAFTRHWAR